MHLAAHFAATAPHGSLQMYISAGFGVFMAWISFKTIFGDFAEFVECLRYWLQPDIISLFRGEWEEDQWAQLKLFAWGVWSIGGGVLLFYSLPRWFPSLFGS